MPADATDLDASETRAVRRLARLFRVERAGAFDRWPPMVIQRMIKRRDALIDSLAAIERCRRRGVDEPSNALTQAITELAQEIQLGRAPAAARLQQLEAELRQRYAGASPGSGLRNGAGGRLLGSG